MGSTAPRTWSPRALRARSRARSSPRTPTRRCLPALPISRQPHWACQVWGLGEQGRALGHRKWHGHRSLESFARSLQDGLPAWKHYLQKSLQEWGGVFFFSCFPAVLGVEPRGTMPLRYIFKPFLKV